MGYYKLRQKEPKYIHLIMFIGAFLIIIGYYLALNQLIMWAYELSTPVTNLITKEK